MTRPTPRSTLFPYTTLFRSSVEDDSDASVRSATLRQCARGLYCRFLPTDVAADETSFWTFAGVDRKSTRLNSSHMSISYAVFCLKKKNYITMSTAIAVMLKY